MSARASVLIDGVRRGAVLACATHMVSDAVFFAATTDWHRRRSSVVQEGGRVCSVSMAALLSALPVSTRVCSTGAVLSAARLSVGVTRRMTVCADTSQAGSMVSTAVSPRSSTPEVCEAVTRCVMAATCATRARSTATALLGSVGVGAGGEEGGGAEGGEGEVCSAGGCARRRHRYTTAHTKASSSTAHSILAKTHKQHSTAQHSHADGTGVSEGAMVCHACWTCGWGGG